MPGCANPFLSERWKISGKPSFSRRLGRKVARSMDTRCPAGDCAAIAERGKLHDDLCDLGEDISPNRAWRLARLAGIRAQIGYKKKPGSYGGSPAVVADNTLNREFDVDAPDQFCLSAIEDNRLPAMGHRHHLHPNA